MASELRQRAQEHTPMGASATNPGTGVVDESPKKEAHPAGEIKHGRLMRYLRGISFAVFFLFSCVAINITQLIGAPLYFVNKDFYYSYMALTKQSFGLLLTTGTYWWGQTMIRISGDASVTGEITKTSDGLVEFSFPERMVMIANHQIYTDWTYLWWVGYANNPEMHGHIYIILKESLKNIPILGWGMQFYSFIFMSRKMSTDQPRMAHRLQKLKKLHTAPGGQKYLDPMWLLLFPEGTNASQNGRNKSAKWAEKIGVKDMQHLLLPRSSGMFFCLNELKGTVDYVYDCTVAYEGIPRGKFGEDYFTLSSTYFEGRPPKSVNFYWRRFRVADIPLDDHDKFDVWLRERWYEKDELMEQYISTGRFPQLETEANGSAKTLKPGFVETEVRTKYPWEFLQMYVILGVFGLVWKMAEKIITPLLALITDARLPWPGRVVSPGNDLHVTAY